MDYSEALLEMLKNDRKVVETSDTKGGYFYHNEGLICYHYKIAGMVDYLYEIDSWIKDFINNKHANFIFYGDINKIENEFRLELMAGVDDVRTTLKHIDNISWVSQANRELCKLFSKLERLG